MLTQMQADAASGQSHTLDGPVGAGASRARWRQGPAGTRTSDRRLRGAHGVTHGQAAEEGQILYHIAAPEPPRLAAQAVRPLQTDLLHPLRGTGFAAREDVQAAADADTDRDPQALEVVPQPDV